MLMPSERGVFGIPGNHTAPSSSNTSMPRLRQAPRVPRLANNTPQGGTLESQGRPSENGVQSYLSFCLGHIPCSKDSKVPWRSFKGLGLLSPSSESFEVIATLNTSTSPSIRESENPQNPETCPSRSFLCQSLAKFKCRPYLICILWSVWVEDPHTFSGSVRLGIHHLLRGWLTSLATCLRGPGTLTTGPLRKWTTMDNSLFPGKEEDSLLKEPGRPLCPGIIGGQGSPLT